MVTEIFLFVLLLALVWYMTKKPSSMPPGSYGLPILGTLPSAKTSITEHFRQLQKIYGDLFTTKWGIHPMVVIADFNLIKKAFQHPDLQGRPLFPSYKMLHQNKKMGIIFNDGEVWADLRRFVLRHLRDLGMGKAVLESSMLKEAEFLVDYLDKHCVGKPAVMDLAINGAVVNVLWLMIASTRYDINDPQSAYYNEQTAGVLEVIQSKMFLLDIFPVLRRILPKFFLNLFFGLDKGYMHAAVLHEMTSGLVWSHLKSLDPHNPRDLIDQFMLEYGDSGSGYALTDENMANSVSIITDLFQAGSETTSTTIRWMILYLAAYPHVQAKVHKALDEVVPPSRLPELDDRSKLPYVDAMLLETLRLSSFVPISLMHRATADVSFEGYVIPKDTVIIACAKICQLSDTAWEKALEFNPDHFLDENGQLNGRKDNFMPFSIGRRQCIGESLARMQLYLFAAAILHKFKIETPEGTTLSLECDPSHSIATQPMPYKVLLRKRN